MHRAQTSVLLMCVAGALQGDAAVKLPTFYAEDTAASANEVWQRIHSDPLFAVLLLPLVISPSAKPELPYLPGSNACELCASGL